ncbi:tyrosine-type recombinase/integrase [Streptomyces sp. NPDC053079]|uniref:tyrosine-type recombinase/integrase n=1 Tax=Streptomyces sp. NPDC053079 TaxID=3365697 RepID=UPI0037D242D7
MPPQAGQRSTRPPDAATSNNQPHSVSRCKTDKLRREAYRLMEKAGVRRVRLYDARHAVLSWMANNGVPDTVVSAWAGHSDLSFIKRIYVHPDPRSLQAGSDKLGELLAP